MFEALKIVLLTLLFGTGASLTPVPRTINAGKTTIHAAKPIKPVINSIQVYVGFGSVSEKIKTAVLTNQLRIKSINDFGVSICDTHDNCYAMKYAGPYFTSSRYGLLYTITDEQLIGKRFTSVCISTRNAIHNISIDWKNYTK